MCPPDGDRTPNGPLERVRAYLAQHDRSLEPLVFEAPLPTSDAAARHLGVTLGQIAKSILFKSGDTFGLFVAPGDARIDAKAVKTHLGGKKPRIARADEVLEMTGFEVGAVCPFALRRDVPVFIDAGLRDHPVVYTAAGVPESLLPISFDRLVAITSGTVVEATV